LGSHYDMLHDSPLATGIEWSRDNVYWVFDGYHEAISRQDFAIDHGMGWDDHNDGEILRYVSGEVKRVESVHSGLALDRSAGMLYVADSGNGRLAVLDVNSGTKGDRLPQVDEKRYPVHNLVDDAVMTTIADEGIETPSGLAMKDDVLYVADNATGRISAYSKTGELIDYLDTGRTGGALQGLNFGPDGALYIADGKASEVLRLSPNPAAFEEPAE
jgi:sugar lactone lactonase YvrE